MDLDFVLDEGGGAFYGPKISVQARDAIGRTWQLSTIQLDFQMPQRFDMEYVGADNARHPPIMIHRALFGSVERFFAVLVEHYAGAFPTWLAPVQVRVLPVRDDHGPYAEEVLVCLAEAGVRVDIEQASEPLGARIRRAKLDKLPYILVVGDDDVTARTVGVNAPGSERPERGSRSGSSSAGSVTRHRLRSLAPSHEAPRRRRRRDPRPPVGGLAHGLRVVGRHRRATARRRRGAPRRRLRLLRGPRSRRF